MSEKAARRNRRNEITLSSEQSAREFVCEYCDIRIAEIENGQMLVRCHSEKPEHAYEIPLEQILAAAAIDPRSREKLMAFYINNPKLKFL